MQIIDADPTRMIDLPGNGPCPRPVDIDQSVTGFERLKSLRIYAFKSGQVIEGESEDDEVYVLPLGGTVGMDVTGAHPLHATLAEDGDCALYMAPGHGYHLTPQGDVQVAYARAAATGRVACHVSAAEAAARGEALAYQRLMLADGAALETDAGFERLVHIVSGALVVGDTRANAPQTVALAKGEAMDIRANGATKLLILRA